MIFPSDNYICKWCGGEYLPYRTMQIICSPECALKYTAKKAEEKASKQWIKEKKVLKEKLKTLGQYETEARKVFQMWIRKVRDKDRACISCGVFNTPQWDAGHFYSANQFSGLMFDQDNVHKQCSVCNDYLSGNLLAYREGLINRYGLEFVERLEKQKDNGRNYKYTKVELVEIKNKYKSLLKCQTKK